MKRKATDGWHFPLQSFLSILLILKDLLDSVVLNYIQSDLQQVFVSQNFGTLKIQNRILERSLLDITLYFCQGNITLFS